MDSTLIKNIAIQSLKKKPVINVYGADYKTKDGTCVRDYMHVSDFCKAIMVAIESNVRNEHFNNAANQPYNTQGIVDMIHRRTGMQPNKIIKWHPETDYLGNHILSTSKFEYHFGFIRNIPLYEGIKMSWNSIQDAGSDYNPLKYLEQAKENNTDLVSFFPKV